MQAHVLTACLTNAMLAGNHAHVVAALRFYVYGGVTFSDSNAAEAVGAIMAALHARRQDAQFFASACCALCSVPAPFPIVAICEGVARHIKEPLVTASGLRLLATANVLEALPKVVSTTANAMSVHARDHNVQYYGARIIIAANALDPEEIKTEYGSFGLDAVLMASLQAAWSSQVDMLRIGQDSWQDLIKRMHPRIR